MIDVSRILGLLSRVPKPPEDRLPPGISDKECDDFEKRNGIPLPPDLRDWLQVANGPCVGPGGLFGIRTARIHLDIESFLAMFPTWKTMKWVPIAGDGCGNYYILPTQHDYGLGYPILFIDGGVAFDTPSYIVASDLEHFLVAILEKELGMAGWPFDEAKVTLSDPRITQFNNVSLPWR